MPWLRSVFGSDGSPIVQYVVIFAVIFTALAAIVFVVRRLTGRGLALPGRGDGRGRQPRLGIVDVYELDRARQLILLRRDNVEHLLLVGGPNDVVVERNIERGRRPPPEASPRPEPLSDPLAAAGRLPEPHLPLPESVGPRSEPPSAPSFEMPVVVPAPVPGSGAAPPVRLPLDAGLLGGDEPGQDIPVPTRAPASAARPIAPPPQPAVEPSVPGREPLSARRILRRTAPPALDAETAPASERVTDAAPPAGRPDPSQTEVATLIPPLAAPAESRVIDPAVLSDMARQLQAALARPASAVTPAPPTVPPEPSREPPNLDTPPAVDPMAAIAAAAPKPVADDEAVRFTGTEVLLPTSEPRSPPSQRDAQVIARPAVAPQPQTTRVPPVGSGSSPRPVPSEPVPKPAGNPFSVEEIEAEFARLLGRPLDRRG